MDTKDEFLRRLRATFKVEADEHLGTIASGLVELEQNDSAETLASTLELVYRAAHSLKGASRAVDLKDIEVVCQRLEGVFGEMKAGELTTTPELFDTLHRTLDMISALLVSTEKEDPERVADLCSDLGALKRDGTPGSVTSTPKAYSTPINLTPDADAVNTARAATPEPAKVTESLGEYDETKVELPRPGVAQPGTVRITTDRLDSLLLQGEEMLSVKLATAQRVIDIADVAGSLKTWNREWARVAPDVSAADAFLRSSTSSSVLNGSTATMKKALSFLDWNREYVTDLGQQLSTFAGSLQSDSRALAGMVDNLMDDMKRVLMLPFTSLTQAFPKMVRDIARAQGKEVTFNIVGADVEVDKRILEQLKDPLVHLIRNSIDHGLEDPDGRARHNKAPRGTLTLAISHVDSNTVEIQVADDGAGIDLMLVKNTAVRRAMISSEEAEKLSEQGIASLLFRSGLTTSPLVTDLSGRGLGLAIVQEKVEALGGTVVVESEPHLGTTFRLRLPVTLATFRGTFVQVSGRDFIIPTTSISRVFRMNRDNIGSVESNESINVDGQVLALVRLGALLNIPCPNGVDSKEPYLRVVVLESGNQHIGFAVDRILHEQEVLVKTLGRQLQRVRNIAGATVSGAGEVVPILNVADLLKSATCRGWSPVAAAETESNEAPSECSILVVEDSITSRTLLKNILESAGYQVTTAVDGIEGLTAVKSKAFDLVVSDIEMPRMDGFDLTSKIRGDEEISDLPVVLVTSLAERKDQERGVEVGANAYIIKSSFDQSNLLDTIQRFV